MLLNQGIIELNGTLLKNMVLLVGVSMEPYLATFTLNIYMKIFTHLYGYYQQIFLGYPEYGYYRNLQDSL